MAGRPNFYTPAERRAVWDDYQKNRGTSQGSTRALAYRHGMSDSTVRRIVEEFSGEKGFGAEETRAITKNATEATRLNLAERRAKLAERLLGVAEKALDEMEEPHQVFNFGGKDNTFESRILPQPPTGDKRNLAIIAATMLDKHRMLDQYDASAQAASAFSIFLESLAGDNATGSAGR